MEVSLITRRRGMGWDDETGITTPQVAAILGIPLCTIIDWAERGIVIADLSPASGYASRRLFSKRAFLRILVARYLISSLGLRRRTATEWLDEMDRKGLFRKVASGLACVKKSEGFEFWLNLEKFAEEAEGLLNGLA
jgi:hypothetical protein